MQSSCTKNIGTINARFLTQVPIINNDENIKFPKYVGIYTYF